MNEGLDYARPVHQKRSALPWVIAGVVAVVLLVVAAAGWLLAARSVTVIVTPAAPGTPALKPDEIAERDTKYAAFQIISDRHLEIPPHGKPASDALTRIPPKYPDAWGQTMTVTQEGSNFRFLSNGPDRKPGTGDDRQYLATDTGNVQRVQP